MKKHYIFFVLLAAIALIGAGCSFGGDKASGKNNETGTMQAQRQTGAALWQDNENLEDASADALAVGTNISVMGEANADGSVTASIILIATEEQLRVLMPVRPQGGTSSSGDNSQTQNNINNTNAINEQNMGTGRDFSQFQNMTDEERQQMRDRFSQRQQDGIAGGGNAGAGMPARTGTRTAGQMSGGRIFGEIISINDSIITVKIADGGSKLVFYTAEVPIKKIKQ